MGSPASDAFKAELEADLAALEPAIRGEEDLSKASIAPETLGEVNEDMDVIKRRRTLEQNVLAAIAELEADGYPELPLEDVSQTVAAELDQQIADLEAARARFMLEQPQAAVITINLGTPVPKTQE